MDGISRRGSVPASREKHREATPHHNQAGGYYDQVTATSIPGGTTESLTKS